MRWGGGSRIVDEGGGVTDCQKKNQHHFLPSLLCHRPEENPRAHQRRPHRLPACRQTKAPMVGLSDDACGCRIEWTHDNLMHGTHLQCATAMHPNTNKKIARYKCNMDADTGCFVQLKRTQIWGGAPIFEFLAHRKKLRAPFHISPPVRRIPIRVFDGPVVDRSLIAHTCGNVTTAPQFFWGRKTTPS